MFNANTQQQLMMAQQQAMLAQQQRAGGVPMATAVPMMSTGAVGNLTNNGTTIAMEFDQCFASYDKLRRTFIVTSKGGAVISTHQVPACPNGNVAAAAAAAAPVEPMNMSGDAEKLGHKKVPVTGAHRWQPRHFKLNGTSLSYHADANSAAKNTIELRNGVVASVLQANEPGKKDRFEDKDVSVFNMLTQPMGAMMNDRSGPIGKPNCVELIVPAQIGNMLGGLANQSALGMAYGGGINDMKKNQARTYYWSCKTLEEANAWVAAINNNCKLAKAPSANNGQMLGNVNLGQIDNLMNQAHGLAADQKKLQDPNETLAWYQRSLKTDLPLEVLHRHLMTFYAALRQNGVAC